MEKLADLRIEEEAETAWSMSENRIYRSRKAGKAGAPRLRAPAEYEKTRKSLLHVIVRVPNYYSLVKSMTVHSWSGNARRVNMPLHKSHFLNNFWNSRRVIPVAESSRASNSEALLSLSVERRLRGRCGWISSAVTSGIYTLSTQG